MTKYRIKDISENSFFHSAVYLDDGFIIASPEIPIDSDIKKSLLDWEFQELLAEGEPQKEPPGDILPFFETSGENAHAPQGVDDERVSRATEIYARLLEFTGKILNRISASPNDGKTGENLPPGQFHSDTGIEYHELADKVRDFCRIIQSEYRYLLRIMQDKYAVNEETGNQGNDPAQFPLNREDYQVSHAVNSLILAVTMGNYLKFNADQLADLAVAALLHEAGMLHIPPDAYLTDKPLTREERRAILSHPILGFNMLKSLNFPQNIRLAVLEHHERENGSGYPRRLAGSKISFYAKIIAVACSFEAITSARPYKDARDGHSGIVDLLKNEGGRYDQTAIRALICSLSIYPIGSYVFLSDGRKAQVVDVNPDEPRYPVVRILRESGDAPIKTSPLGLHILRLVPEKGTPEE
ncbi:MAG: HD-GYP domain-containing protein [Treponema sp.]|jgi:HD-GYP domain-containing protein (c-di-GMP phosphodiesterase class II)|nr:HD-GYP domain-containing protein [Treponema sp.]